jgi:hypothetical protein
MSLFISKNFFSGYTSALVAMMIGALYNEPYKCFREK